VMRRIGIVTGRIGTSRGQVRRATAREAVVLCLQAFGLAFAAGVVVVAIAQGTLAQRAPELPDNVTRVVVMGLASVILALLLRRRQP